MKDKPVKINNWNPSSKKFRQLMPIMSTTTTTKYKQRILCGEKSDGILYCSVNKSEFC